MKLVESILSRNPCYTAGKKIKVTGLMLHSVGCPQPKASTFINSWNSPSHNNSCVHGFIDGNDGTVYQTLPWDHRGWHCGSGSKGSGNNSHIVVEMCEPACIKYTGGANFTCADPNAAKAVAKRTYEAAVELFAMLCKKFGLDPLADGVVISHKEGHDRGIASNHGDPEHLWSQLGTGYTMDGFRKAVKDAMGAAVSETVEGGTKIMGAALATVEQMASYIKGKNPDVPQSVVDMIPFYLSEGQAEGVRGDVAFAQSCLETGNFGFSGSAVTLDQNNFCGMGVTANGMKGNSFDTPQMGIRAQIQHLKAYASMEPLNEDCIDSRFQYVKRGCAEYVEWLGQQENPQGAGWAAGGGYGGKILTILNGILSVTEGTSPAEQPEPEVWYRVRKTWDDAASQKGAFKVMEYAKACADENSGYSVFDENGRTLYSSAGSFEPFLVKVNTSYLNIRKGPGTNHSKTGKYTGIGVFTIVEVQPGEGSDSGWGLLKSYADDRDGWISLDITERV